MEGKKLAIPNEIAYAVALILNAFGVALVSASGFGVSMIVAPAYLLSLKIDWLSFGMAEYVVQGILFIILIIILRKFKFTYLFSFLTCVVYGIVLDLWRLIPVFNQSIYPPETLKMWLRVVFFVLGMIITAFAIAVFFKTYIYPQVYDFFVTATTKKYNLKVSLFKTIFDVSFLVISLIMTFCLFKEIKGIGIGTFICAALNGILISLFSKFLDRFFIFPPIFVKHAALFDI